MFPPEREENKSNSSELFSQKWNERIQRELDRMRLAEFIPQDINIEHLQDYRDKIFQWMSIFQTADDFVHSNIELIKGADLLSPIPLIPVTNASDSISDVVHYLNGLPKFCYEYEPWYSNGDHPMMNSLLRSVFQHMFVDPGDVEYVKYSVSREKRDSYFSRKYKTRKVLQFWSGFPNIPEVEGFDRYLVLHSGVQYSHFHKGMKFDDHTHSFHIEYNASNVAYTLLLDMYESVNISSFIVRKCLTQADGRIDVRLTRIHPSPVFVHYDSHSKRVEYAVPIHRELGFYTVIPGTESANPNEIPIANSTLASFIF